MRSTKS